MEKVLAALDGLIKMSKERYDKMEIDEKEEEKKDLITSSVEYESPST